MAEYEILIFMSGDKLRTAEVGSDGSVKMIQFHGEPIFEFDGEKEIDDFYASVADTYSVDDLGDLDAEIFLVDCGAPEKEKWQLLEKLRSCASLNTVTLQKVFPMLLTKAGCCNAGQKTVAEFLGEKYAFICDDDCHFEEISAKGKKAGVTLDVKDFSFLAVFDGQAFSGGGNAVTEKALVEKEEAIERLCQENARLKQENQDITVCAQELKEESDKFWKWLEEKVSETKQKSSGKLVSRRRAVFVDECNFCGATTMVLNIIDEHKTGTIVSASQEIAELYWGRGGEFGGRVYASRDGKIVWVALSGDKVIHGQLVAVIGDEEDDEEEMLAWGEEQATQGQNGK